MLKRGGIVACVLFFASFVHFNGVRLIRHLNVFKIFRRNGIRWIRKQDALYLGLLSIIIGLLAGYGALMIRHSIEWISAFWTGSTSWSAVLHSTPWYFFILAPTCGGLLVGCINLWWLDTKQTLEYPFIFNLT